MEVSVVLLTGGSSGIGAATAHLLASAGMKVYCGSRRGTIDHPQEGIIPVKLDVNDAEGLQACLPVFRKQHFGRIVTVSSVMAVLQLPYQGFYSSAKAALLSLSQSLSMELRGTGIECCCILPGDVATGFTAARKLNQAATDPASPYKAGMERNLKKIEHDELGGMAPEVIGKAIRKQLTRRHMAVRVIPRIDYKLVGFLVRILPAKWVLYILTLLYN